MLPDTVVSALLVGLTIGAIPAVAGAVKGKLGPGLGGFVACMSSGLLPGILLAIPVCVVFMYLIYKKPAPQFMPPNAIESTHVCIILPQLRQPAGGRAKLLPILWHKHRLKSRKATPFGAQRIPFAGVLRHHTIKQSGFGTAV